MPFKPIHLLWLLANGPAKVNAFPLHQNQLRETSSTSTSSIDLANIVTPVTLTTSHTSPTAGSATPPVGTTVESESHQRSIATSTAVLTVSQTLQPSSDISSGSRPTASASTITKPSPITPQPSLAPSSATTPETPVEVAINIRTLNLNVPALIMEHTVTTTVFFTQTPAVPLTPITTSYTEWRQ